MFEALKTTLSLFKGHKGRLSFVFLLAFLSISAKMGIPFLSGLAIDSLRQEFTFDGLLPYLFVLFSLLLIGMVARYFFDYFSNKLVETVLYELREKIFAGFVDSSLSELEKRKQGDILSTLLGDMDTLQRGLVSGVVALFEGVMQIAITVAFMFVLSYILSLAVILLTPISIFVSRGIAKSNASSFQRQNAMLAEVSAFTLECLSNASTLSCYDLWEKKEEEFQEKTKSLQKSNFSANFAASLINPSTRLVNNAIYAILIFSGAAMILFKPSFAPLFTVGALSSFLSYAYQYMAPFNEVADASSDVIFASVAAKRIEGVIGLKKESKEGKKANASFSSLTMEDIHFGYVPGKEVLKGINIHIKKGSKIALVGTTGCGKTTLLSLLMRFYDPTSGDFYLDEEALSKASISSSRQMEGIILQDAILLTGTVKDNIALGKKDASMDEVIKAAREAGADDFIRALPNGYNEMVSQSYSLSEGQKQMLCLARVLLLDNELLLLDEATSHLDLLTEVRLQKSFNELCKGKTSIIVAHRLSTVADADMILVMDNGSIVEAGHYKELIKANGFFAELYRSQLS